ncbi:MAG: murein L,D-transpeptidase family protein [Alphaproteobacteria bacterium]
MVRSKMALGIGCALAAVLAAGCAARRGGGALDASPADDRKPLEWAKSEPNLVVVHRSCKTVSFYRYGQWVRTWDQVSLGQNPGVKEQEGDRKTPDGLYRITGKRAHERWSRFMLLDYPNAKDLAVHHERLATGRVNRGPGGEVGIHGTDKPKLNETSYDWTWGCVSLMNKDVNELYDLAPSGTLVLIED